MAFNPNQQKRKQNNFFTKSKDRYKCDNFLERMDAREMQNGAVSLFRDLAKGRINIEEYGECFLNQQLMDNILLEANTKLMHHSINFNALNWFMMANGVNDIPHQQSLDSNRKSMVAYNMIVDGLSKVKFTGDVNYLFALVNNLRPYRGNI